MAWSSCEIEPNLFINSLSAIEIRLGAIDVFF